MNFHGFVVHQEDQLSYNLVEGHRGKEKYKGRHIQERNVEYNREMKEIIEKGFIIKENLSSHFSDWVCLRLLLIRYIRERECRFYLSFI